MRDSTPNAAGDPGMSRSPRKAMLAMTPNPASTFFTGATVCLSVLKSFPFVHLNKVKAVKHVYR